MSLNTGRLRSATSITRSFLLSKFPDPPPPLAKTKSGIAGMDLLTNVFPEIPTGEQFVNEALSRLETALRFTALWFRIDGFDDIIAENDEAEMLTRLVPMAKCINAECRKHRGIWGLPEQDIFACLFPGNGGRDSLDQIRACYREACGGSLTAGVARYPIAMFTRRQTFENARKAIDHAVFFSPEGTAVFDATSLNISGDGCYNRGDVNAAIEEYRKALILDPSNMNVHNSLGVCYGVLGAAQSALEEFASAMQLAPEDAMPVYNTGVVHMRSGNLDAALDFFRCAARMAPEVFEIAFQLGRLYLDADRPESAMPHFQTALRLNPDSGVPHRYLGECCERLELIQEAISHYQKAIRANPNDAASLAALGHLFCRCGENTEIALTFCRHSVDISPHSGALREKLGDIFLALGRLDEALNEFEQAAALGFDCSARIKKTISLKAAENERCHIGYTG